MFARAGLCLGLAALLVVLPRLRRHWSVAPALLATAALLFHAARLGSGLGIAQAQANGWLLGPFPAAGALPSGLAGVLGAMPWSAIAAAAPFAASAIVLTSVSLLMAVGGVELELRANIDANRELRVGGLANLLGGLLGGTPSTQSLTNTSMLHWLG